MCGEMVRKAWNERPASLYLIRRLIEPNCEEGGKGVERVTSGVIQVNDVSTGESLSRGRSPPGTCIWWMYHVQ